jgi:glycosyltransferase involved in cell wall biosynthesis
LSGLDKAITGISGISEDESAIASSGPIAQTEVDASKLNDPDQHSVENPQPAGEPAGVRPGAAQATDFRFFIDSVSDKQIEGWIIRTEQPLHRCVVALREGDHILARAIASRFRADLTSAGIGDGCHSFVIPTPPELLDGAEHLLEIIEQETGVLLVPQPIRWRSARAASHSTFSGMGDQLEAARPFGAAQLPGPAAEGWLAKGWPDAGDRRSSVPRAMPPTRSRERSPTPGRVATRLLFDISDLVYYIGEHANLTGIQRVQSSIVLAILGNELFPQARLTFLSFNARTRNWVAVPTGFLFTLLEDILLPEDERLVSFPAEEARYGVLPGGREFTGFGVLDDGSASVLCLLGAAWVHQDYLHRVLALKRQFGTKFVMTVHDLIPIYARETCDQDTARVFEEFMQRALRHADHLLSVSENTAADLRRYTAALQIPTPPITVTRNGSSFGEFLPKLEAEGDLLAEDLPDRFVLFVATIEGRKNHDLMFKIWQRLIADGDDPPALVCVGRLGWKSSAFISALVETDYLGGRIRLLRDISDADLRLLYRRCLFTVCPTFYEGWGLPIGESLAMGKICISSDRASVPEVAGEFGVYIDIDDVDASLAAIRGMIADAPKRKRLEAKIRRDYKPITWHSVADKVVEACLAASQIKWQEPYPYTAIPYSTEISFGRLDRNIDGTGELLLARIEHARKGIFLPDYLTDLAFQRGEEARSGGYWAYPEEWGTWACFHGGEIVLALPHDDSLFYYVVLRLRTNAPAEQQLVRISANGDTVWADIIGPDSRDIAVRVRRNSASAEDGWRLRLRAQIDLTPELHRQILAIDGRVPTIGFERLIVVPENDLKTRLDVMYALLL